MWDWWRMFRLRRLQKHFSPQRQEWAIRRGQDRTPLREIERERRNGSSSGAHAPGPDGVAPPPR